MQKFSLRIWDAKTHESPVVLSLSPSSLASTDPVCPSLTSPGVLCAHLPPGASGAPTDAPVQPYQIAQPSSNQCPQGDRDPVPVTPTSFLPGCCRQWYPDSVATHAHGPCQLRPQAHWQQAYRSHRGGSSCRRCPQPLILQRQQQQQQRQRQRQPPPLPPSPLRQRLCPVRGAQKGSPAIAAARMGPASAPQPATPSSPTAVSAMASSGPALPPAAGALLEPSEPTEARPLPAPPACGSFTSYGAGAQSRPSFGGCVPICLASAWACCSLASSLGLSSVVPVRTSAYPNSLVSLPQLLGVPDFWARPVLGASAPVPLLVACPSAFSFPSPTSTGPQGQGGHGQG